MDMQLKMNKYKHMYHKVFLSAVVFLSAIFVTTPIASADESSLVLKSCKPDKSVTDSAFALKRGESVTFKCTVLNTGSDVVSVLVAGLRINESKVEDKTSVTSVYLENIPAGQSVDMELPFIASFENGSYRYDISLQAPGRDGKQGEIIGIPLSFTGKLDAPTVKVVNAKLDKDSYKEGDDAVLSLELTPIQGATDQFSINIATKGKDGSVCAYVSVMNPVGLEQYPFRFSSGKASCDVVTVVVSVNDMTGYPVDTRVIPTTFFPISSSEATQGGQGLSDTPALFSNLSTREIGIAIVVVLLFVSTASVVFLRWKKGAIMGMWLWIFIPATLLFVSLSAHVAVASCSLITNLFGGALNGHEQVRESLMISNNLSEAGGNGGVSGGSSYRNSYFQFRATNSVYFTLDGVNLGSQITIVHKQDWIGVATNICGGWLGGWLEGTQVDDSDCTYYAIWGRSDKTLSVVNDNIFRTNGTCGSSNGGTYSSAPSDGLCSSGSPSSVSSPFFSSRFNWTCYGSCGGSDSSCSATKVPPGSIPTVTVTINNQHPTFTGTLNDPLHIVWTSSNATSCVATLGYNFASGGASIGTSGSKDILAAYSPDPYTVQCIGRDGVTATDSVTVILACAVSCDTEWSACSKACGTGEQSRTCTSSTCSPYTETQSCNTNACTQSNWREVAPGW